MSYQSDNMAFNNAMDSFSHHGVLGMKWGHRNQDTLRKYAGPQGRKKRTTTSTDSDKKDGAKKTYEAHKSEIERADKKRSKALNAAIDKYSKGQRIETEEDYDKILEKAFTQDKKLISADKKSRELWNKYAAPYLDNKISDISIDSDKKVDAKKIYEAHKSEIERANEKRQKALDKAIAKYSKGKGIETEEEYDKILEKAFTQDKKLISADKESRELFNKYELPYLENK